MKKYTLSILIILLGCSSVDVNSTITIPTSIPVKESSTIVSENVLPQSNTVIVEALSDICSAPMPGAEMGNDYFVFSASWGGNPEIYSIDELSGLQKKITTNLAADVHHLHPELNHSKNKLAFLRYEGGKGELYIIDTQNGNEKLISPKDVSVVPGFFWSPNDQCILFTGQSVQAPDFTDVYITTVDGITHNLTINETMALGAYASSWALDGKSVLFSGHLDTHLTIWHTFIVDLQSGAIIDLTKNQFGDWSPAWNPRKDLIAFIGFSDYINKGSIFLLEPINFTQEEVIVPTDKPWTLAWALDGEKLFYVTTSEQSDITTYDLWVWDIKTEEARMIMSVDDDILEIIPVKVDEIIVYIYSSEKENIAAYSVDIESGHKMIIVEDINY